MPALKNLLPPRYRRRSNLSTWALCIATRNNPHLHQLLIAMLQNRDQLTPTGARLIAGRLFPLRILPITGARWSTINWQHVAQSWTDLHADHQRNSW